MQQSIFHRLYDTYHQDVFNFLFYLVKDRTTAEDLAHEVYVRVLKSYDRFEGKSSEKTWLFSIAKNVAIDHFRKKQVRDKHAFTAFDWETEQLVSPIPSPEQFTELNDQLHQLLVALEECSGDQKMVIIMRFIQELSIQETAEILGWTPGKVKTTQHRALKNLRLLLEAQEGREANPL
ncbi:RNA polymerase sigma factor SigX [Solibacillus sp. FSL W7-1472]|mgnify:CR=1 FL=1|uniref:RNA polymerase sigma factor SigX n=1 Tax=Solibacillus sp. FSL W7-1472 TaxID=2921707 RepID=UPI0007FB323B|nr:RNA polymerase sigma factor SigX [Solibacillus silvestris]OBW56585.1 RNA polymerase sigma factor SigX [Solibacillus silvestris]